MTQQILDYTSVLQKASDKEIGYNEATNILDGACPADWQQVIVDLLWDEVKAGRITQNESDSFQISNLPY